MFADEDLLPLSALQHLTYCRRRCMLVHGEAAWAENTCTAQGRVLHQRTHSESARMEGGRLVTRSLRLVSYRLGLSGMADVVEFHPLPPASSQVSGEKPDQAPGLPAGPGICLPGRPGQWQPFPVEYKRGGSKTNDAYVIQLCAQALCLEEMLNTVIPEGALFYGQTRRRQLVSFDSALRGRVKALAAQLHELIAAGLTPPPEPGPKCDRCSMQDICLPHQPASARNYIRRMLTGAERSEF